MYFEKLIFTRAVKARLVHNFNVGESVSIPLSLSLIGRQHTMQTLRCVTHRAPASFILLLVTEMTAPSVCVCVLLS